MYSNVMPFRKIGFELIPQLRRLIGIIPRIGLVSLAEDALLRSRAFFVAPHSDDQSVEAVIFDDLFQSFGLQQSAALEASEVRSRSGFDRIPIRVDDQFDAELLRHSIAILYHCRYLSERVNVNKRKRHVPEECLLRQPQQYGRVFSDRPQHSELAEFVVSLAENVNALRFELRQSICICQCDHHRQY